jgi:hypothetical protein
MTDDLKKFVKKVAMPEAGSEASFEGVANLSFLPIERADNNHAVSPVSCNRSNLPEYACR